MQNKRGQFYLIAAIIIVVVLASFATLTTYATVKQSPKTINNLGEDLQEEGPRIIDYGIYTEDDIMRVLNNFSKDEFAPYFLQLTEDANLIFIYGNKTNLQGVRYNTTSTGRIYATIGGQTASWKMSGDYTENMTIDTSTLTNNITVTLLNKDYVFDLKNNNMFYFVIAEEKEGETYVKKNK